MTDVPEDPKPPKRSKILNLAEFSSRAEKRKTKAGSNGKAETKPPPVDDTESPMYSDIHLSLIFVKEHKDNVRYVAKWGKWFIWGETHWIEDDVMQARDLSCETCRRVSLKAEKGAQQKKIASNATVSAVEKLAQSNKKIRLRFNAWDRGLWLFNDLSEPTTESESEEQ
jgi:hypothetical protein